MKKREVTQIVAAHIPGATYKNNIAIVALCDDGTIYQYRPDWGTGWMPVPAIPQPAETP